MPDDRWWRGVDADVLGAIAAGSRILDVGCGDGGLVDRLAAGGLDARGVDPRAPDSPRLIRTRVEESASLGHFDAACAVMSLHHARLDAVIDAIARCLYPGGRLFVYDFAWEDYDDRSASWLDVRDRSHTDNSVTAWRVEHADLHTGDAIHQALRRAFELRGETSRPYLARMLGRHELEHEEQAAIAEGTLPALGRWYVASAG